MYSLKYQENLNTVFDGVIAPPRHCTPPIFRILKHFILTCHCTPHFEIIRKLFKCIIVIYEIYCDFEKIILRIFNFFIISNKIYDILMCHCTPPRFYFNLLYFGGVMTPSNTVAS